MKTSILLINFNYSKDTNNKAFLKKLYEPHFKKIYFYSDLPQTDDDEINFVNTSRGCFTHRIFVDFFEKYQEEINQSDGVFYIHDDCILNTNQLNFCMPDKILYNRHGSGFYNLKELSEVLINKNLKWTHWYQSYGIKAVEQIKNNPISKFYSNFSDFFYLPTKYFNKELIDLFNLYSNVFLEIAIPTVINYINCYKDYQEFKSAILWGTDRNKILDINFLEDSVNNSLVVHPVKFNKYPQLKKHIEKLLS